MFFDRQTEEEQVFTVGLQRELAEDAGGERRQKICDELEAYASEIKRAINGGLPTDEYQQAEALRVAINAAANVVDKVWELEQAKA